MGKEIKIYTKRVASLLIYPAKPIQAIAILVTVLWLLGGCVTPSTKEISADEAKGPIIEQVKVSSSPSETTLEIINSRSAPYTAFKLIDPPRVILDIRGEPGKDLPSSIPVNNSNLKEIRFEEGKTQAMTTRMVVDLSRPVDYQAMATDNMIRLTFTPKKIMTKAQKQEQEDRSKAMQEKKEPAEARVVPSEPRILLKPRASILNQVLGIDFTMLDHGKSRVTVTTDKRVRYDMDRKGAKTIVLKLSETTIPPLLLREIDTSNFNGALDRIKPAFFSAKKVATLAISLREMVPFHVKQTDNVLNIEFGQTSIKPPEKKIIPLKLSDAQTRALAAMQPPTAPLGAPAVPQAQKKKFKGEPMYLDFVNADVTHILRLINDISKENIIWDPAIKGKKVSMILKNVPWDEALELILKNNALAKRYVGDNIIWITTKAKMKQVLAEEEAEARKIQKRIDDERKKKLDEEKKTKEEEPLITAYLPVDFASADEIKGHITLTKRGTMSVDTRTNTIIVKDIASSIEDAKKIVKQFDTPVKQIIIEARIVDASDSFSRDLGLQWVNNGIEIQNRKDSSMSWSGTPLWAPGNAAADFASGNDQRLAGGFTTNAPANWASNITLSFARLSGNQLGGIGLDAALALAETESKANVMSAPKVIAREGTAASISSGDSIIIPATENVASTTLDATLSLTVTPTAVSYNNFITLDVSVTDDQAPSTSRLLRKSITTTLMIQSGETVVIGGIIRENKSKNISGVPVLRDIPGLGWLFKAENKVLTKSELLIFLTPTVLPAPVKNL